MYLKPLICNQSNSYPGLNEILCAIWNHLHSLTNVKNTCGGVSLLVKLQTETFSKLYKGTKSHKVSQMLYGGSEKEWIKAPFKVAAILRKILHKRVGFSKLIVSLKHLLNISRGVLWTMLNNYNWTVFINIVND